MNKGTFVKNSATYGGAIEDEGDGIVVNNSYFQQNTATSEGGAIADYESLTLNNTIFNYNFGPEYAVPSTPTMAPRSGALPSRATALPMAAVSTTTTS